MPSVVRPDGVRIDYEAHGHGPPVILLHGGGQSRQTWLDGGYVAELAETRQVILLDFRGHGASDKPMARAAYALELQIGDVLAVADACGAARFDLVGYSFGGNVGRYIAARARRVDRFVLIGISFFGRGAEGSFRAMIDAMLAPWAPVLANPPDPDAVPPHLLAEWKTGTIQRRLAWFGALLDWPSLPAQPLGCPALWLVGSRNEVGALDNLAEHAGRLTELGVVAHVLAGLDHAGEMTASDVVLPCLREFLL